MPSAVTSALLTIALGLTAVVAVALTYRLRRLRARHRAQSALLHTVLRRFPCPAVVTGPTGAVQAANPAAVELLNTHQAAGHPLDLAALIQTGPDPHEVRLTRPDGPAGDILVESIPVEDGTGTVFVLLDVSTERVHEESLHHAAYHDALTGLPNRAMLWQHLNAAAADRSPYTVLLVDLDDFRAVNDTHGHQTGDELLTAVAHRLRDAAYAETRSAPHRAVVARLGGDEFAVLLQSTDARAADRLARALRATFDRPFGTSAGRLTARARIGAADMETVRQ
jgi:diguanylate cyclase (GGDEF)-like protein